MTGFSVLYGHWLHSSRGYEMVQPCYYNGISKARIDTNSYNWTYTDHNPSLPS